MCIKYYLISLLCIGNCSMVNAAAMASGGQGSPVSPVAAARGEQALQQLVTENAVRNRAMERQLRRQEKKQQFCDARQARLERDLQAITNEVGFLEAPVLGYPMGIAASRSLLNNERDVDVVGQAAVFQFMQSGAANIQPRKIISVRQHPYWNQLK